MYREFGFRNTGRFFFVGIWNPGNLSCGILNPGLWIPEHSSWNQNPTDDVIRSPESKFPDKKSGIQYLESGIQVLGLYESKFSPMIFNWVVSPYSIPLQNLLNQSGLTKIYSPLLIGHINMSANNLQIPA